MHEARDIDDPQRLAELRWNAAIAAWMRRDPAPLVALLGELRDVPDFAVEFLRDLAAGTVERPSGAEAARSPAHERRIAFAVYAAWEALEAEPRSRAGSPKDRAIATVAQRLGMAQGQVRGVLDKVTRQGLTRDVWARFLRDT